MATQPLIEFKQEWETIEEVIGKLTCAVESNLHSQGLISGDDYLHAYTTVYDMCQQTPPSPSFHYLYYSQQLYDKYRQSLLVYVDSVVLSSLQEAQHDQLLLLREFVKRWNKYQTFAKFLSSFFSYLECLFIPLTRLPGLKHVGLDIFQNSVYLKVKGKLVEAMVAMINKDREGEQIDRASVKNVLDIFVEFGRDCYVNDFEAEMLRDAVAYYSRKLEDCHSDVGLQIEELCRGMRSMASAYLHSSSLDKIEKQLHGLKLNR